MAMVFLVGSWNVCDLVGQNKGRLKGAEEEKVRAINAGAAEWVIDPKTGKKSFQYKVSSQ